MANELSYFTAADRGDAVWFVARGFWVVSEVAAIESDLNRWSRTGRRPVKLDLSGVQRLDTAGALLLHRTCQRLEAEGMAVELIGMRHEHAALLGEVVANERPPAPPPLVSYGVARLIERVGRASLFFWSEAKEFIAFIGIVVEVAGRLVLRPQRFRFTATVYHMEQAGLNALPIVGLISFLIGLVLAYQGATQLERFGASIFVANLIGISVLRELGILLTSIVIAGRSGSAFTAEIGAMKVREEVDAMRTLGLDPIEVLVLPRMLALMITLPLLGFFADIMGLLGGGVMAWSALGISPDVYLERVNYSVTFGTFMVGLVKAPVFAALIAAVGCYQGLRVEGSAESVGRLTTRSVVQSIFLVIVVDAAFSIFFNLIGV